MMMVDDIESLDDIYVPLEEERRLRQQTTHPNSTPTQAALEILSGALGVKADSDSPPKPVPIQRLPHDANDTTLLDDPTVVPSTAFRATPQTPQQSASNRRSESRAGRYDRERGGDRERDKERERERVRDRERERDKERDRIETSTPRKTTKAKEAARQRKHTSTRRVLEELNHHLQLHDPVPSISPPRAQSVNPEYQTGTHRQPHTTKDPPLPVPFDLPYTRTRTYTTTARSTSSIGTMLAVTSERLQQETRRADEAEKQANEVLRLLKEVVEAKGRMEKEVRTLREEKEMWRVRLDEAQSEIFRAQNVVKQIDQQRLDAENEAKRLRDKLRKVYEERAVENARDEGRKAGFEEGLRHGRILGVASSRAVEEEEDRERELRETERQRERERRRKEQEERSRREEEEERRREEEKRKEEHEREEKRRREEDERKRERDRKRRDEAERIAQERLREQNEKKTETATETATTRSSKDHFQPQSRPRRQSNAPNPRHPPPLPLPPSQSNLKPSFPVPITMPQPQPESQLSTATSPPPMPIPASQYPNPLPRLPIPSTPSNLRSPPQKISTYVPMMRPDSTAPTPGGARKSTARREAVQLRDPGHVPGNRDVNRDMNRDGGGQRSKTPAPERGHYKNPRVRDEEDEDDRERAMLRERERERRYAVVGVSSTAAWGTPDQTQTETMTETERTRRDTMFTTGDSTRFSQFGMLASPGDRRSIPLGMGNDPAYRQKVVYGRPSTRDEDEESLVSPGGAGAGLVAGVGGRGGGGQRMRTRSEVDPASARQWRITNASPETGGGANANGKGVVYGNPMASRRNDTNDQGHSNVESPRRNFTSPVSAMRTPSSRPREVVLPVPLMNTLVGANFASTSQAYPSHPSNRNPTHNNPLQFNVQPARSPRIGGMQAMHGSSYSPNTHQSQRQQLAPDDHIIQMEGPRRPLHRSGSNVSDVPGIQVETPSSHGEGMHLEHLNHPMDPIMLTPEMHSSPLPTTQEVEGVSSPPHHGRDQVDGGGLGLYAPQAAASNLNLNLRVDTNVGSDDDREAKLITGVVNDGNFPPGFVPLSPIPLFGEERSVGGGER